MLATRDERSEAPVLAAVQRHSASRQKMRKNLVRLIRLENRYDINSVLSSGVIIEAFGIILVGVEHVDLAAHVWRLAVGQDWIYSKYDR